MLTKHRCRRMILTETWGVFVPLLVSSTMVPVCFEYFKALTNTNAMLYEMVVSSKVCRWE